MNGSNNLSIQPQPLTDEQLKELELDELSLVDAIRRYELLLKEKGLYCD
jgi:hypothetical protein